MCIAIAGRWARRTTCNLFPSFFPFLRPAWFDFCVFYSLLAGRDKVIKKRLDFFEVHWYPMSLKTSPFTRYIIKNVHHSIQTIALTDPLAPFSPCSLSVASDTSSPMPSITPLLSAYASVTYGLPGGAESRQMSQYTRPPPRYPTNQVTWNVLVHPSATFLPLVAPMKPAVNYGQRVQGDVPGVWAAIHLRKEGQTAMVHARRARQFRPYVYQ